MLINIDNTEKTNAYSKIQDFEEFFTVIGNYAKVGYAHFNAVKCDGYAVNSWYRNIGEKMCIRDRVKEYRKSYGGGFLNHLLPEKIHLCFLIR